MVTCGPEKFAEWFNDKYPGVYRKVVTDDVKDMTDCGLFYHHGYYSGSSDCETIRAVLQYEQLRENRLTRQSNEKNPQPAGVAGTPWSQTQKTNRDDQKNVAANVNPIEIKKGRRDYIIGVENDTSRNLMVMKSEYFDINFMVILAGIVDPSQEGIFRLRGITVFPSGPV